MSWSYYCLLCTLKFDWFWRALLQNISCRSLSLLLDNKKFSHNTVSPTLHPPKVYCSRERERQRQRDRERQRQRERGHTASYSSTNHVEYDAYALICDQFPVGFLRGLTGTRNKTLQVYKGKGCPLLVGCNNLPNPPPPS